MYQHYTQMASWLALVLSVLGIGPVAAGTLTGAPGPSQLSEAIVWAEPVGTVPAFAPPTQHAVMAQANLAFHTTRAAGVGRYHSGLSQPRHDVSQRLFVLTATAL